LSLLSSDEGSTHAAAFSSSVGDRRRVGDRIEIWIAQNRRLAVRRRESGLDLLIALPWYIAAAIGVGLWLGASSIGSFIASSSPILAQSSPVIAQLARLASYVCLAAAGLSLLRAFFVRRKFAAQRSIADLRALTWQQFETIVGEAFRRKGYSVIENGQGGADGGVDLVMSKDGKRYLVQCKQYRASTVSVTIVREIFGVVAAQRAAGAIVVTTGAFTKDAIEFAKSQPIELIDGRALEAMVRGINGVTTPLAGISASSSSSSPRSSSPSPAPSPAASPVISCPKCGSEMARRTPRAGGTAFYGCSTFPKCRGTRPIS
jgi:restriction system protein